MRIERKNSLIVIIDVLCCVIAYAVSLYWNDNYNILFYVVTSMYVYMIISWYYVSGKIFNYFTVLIALTYIYYYGQVILYAFNRPIRFQYTITNTLTKESIVKAAYYLLINVLVLHASAIFFNKRVKKGKQRDKLNVANFRSYRFTAIVVLCVSFVCQVMLLLYKYTINITLGYANALGSVYDAAGSFSTIVNFLATMYLPAFFLALVTTRYNKILNKFVWASYGVYLVLYFMSGSRFDAIISLAGVVLLYHYCYREIKIIQAIIIGGIGMLALFVCAVMSNIRIVENGNFSSIYNENVSEAVERTLENSFIEENLAVTGLQLLSVTTVMENCPSKVDFTYGIYYLQGFMRIIPNIFISDNNILITKDIDTIFHEYLTKTYGMGSSFIVEAYYNFGYFGVLMMIIYGYMIAFINKKNEEVRFGLNQNDLLIGFLFYIICRSFFWVRSDARMLPREIVFYYLGFLCLSWIVKNVVYRKNYK